MKRSHRSVTGDDQDNSDLRPNRCPPDPDEAQLGFLSQTNIKRHSTSSCTSVKTPWTVTILDLWVRLRLHNTQLLTIITNPNTHPWFLIEYIASTVAVAGVVIPDGTTRRGCCAVSYGGVIRRGCHAASSNLDHPSMRCHHTSCRNRSRRYKFNSAEANQSTLGLWERLQLRKWEVFGKNLLPRNLPSRLHYLPSRPLTSAANDRRSRWDAASLSGAVSRVEAPYSRPRNHVSLNRPPLSDNQPKARGCGFSC